MQCVFPESAHLWILGVKIHILRPQSPVLLNQIQIEKSLYFLQKNTFVLSAQSPAVILGRPVQYALLRLFQSGSQGYLLMPDHPLFHLFFGGNVFPLELDILIGNSAVRNIRRKPIQDPHKLFRSLVLHAFFHKIRLRILRNSFFQKGILSLHPSVFEKGLKDIFQHAGDHIFLPQFRQDIGYILFKHSVWGENHNIVGGKPGLQSLVHQVGGSVECNGCLPASRSSLDHQQVVLHIPNHNILFLLNGLHNRLHFGRSVLGEHLPEDLVIDVQICVKKIVQTAILDLVLSFSLQIAGDPPCGRIVIGRPCHKAVKHAGHRGTPVIYVNHGRGMFRQGGSADVYLFRLRIPFKAEVYPGKIGGFQKSFQASDFLRQIITARSQIRHRSHALAQLHKGLKSSCAVQIHGAVLCVLPKFSLGLHHLRLLFFHGFPGLGKLFFRRSQGVFQISFLKSSL